MRRHQGNEWDDETRLNWMYHQHVHPPTTSPIHITAPYLIIQLNITTPSDMLCLESKSRWFFLLLLSVLSKGRLSLTHSWRKRNLFLSLLIYYEASLFLLSESRFQTRLEISGFVSCRGNQEGRMKAYINSWHDERLVLFLIIFRWWWCREGGEVRLVLGGLVLHMNNWLSQSFHGL